jgi:hypothetical protein
LSQSTRACCPTTLGRKIFLFIKKNTLFSCIVILLEKSILNGIGKGRKEMEDGGKFSLGVSPKFFDGIDVRRIGREVN